MAATFVKPSQTLYVRNVCDKASKIELKTSLYHLFAQHGPVIDVVYKKTAATRGQAFVVFRDVASATAAMRALQGFPFFERALKIEYAKAKSSAVSLLEGRVAPPKRNGAAAAAAPVQAEDNDNEDEDNEQESKDPSNKRAREDEPAANGDDKKRKTAEVEEEEDDDVDMEEDDDDEDENPASKILFLTHLPSQITSSSDALTTLFKDYAGFKEVRLIPGKSDLAFVEYSTLDQAAEAKKRLDGFSIMQGKVLKIQYAKV
ncbi:hypothetical protein HDU98_011330 [Podochytrium sp. JEL0797]|nr:hypothetical protein HDU98_011330 [Podochytrium sp. JEL0797]